MMDLLLKLEPGAYVMCVLYVCYHAPLALETMARAGDHLGLDCPDGWKKAARQQVRIPLVLGVPFHLAFHPRRQTYACTRPTAPVLTLVTCPSCVNLANSIKCMGDSRSYLSYRRSYYALLVPAIK